MQKVQWLQLLGNNKLFIQLYLVLAGELRDDLPLVSYWPENTKYKYKYKIQKYSMDQFQSSFTSR